MAELHAFLLARRLPLGQPAILECIALGAASARKGRQDSALVSVHPDEEPLGAAA